MVKTVSVNNVNLAPFEVDVIKALNTEKPYATLYGVVKAHLKHAPKDDVLDRLNAIRRRVREPEEDVILDVVDTILADVML